MHKIELPARDDARWADFVWRREKLGECIAAHRLSNQDVADLTGHRLSSIEMWLRSKRCEIGVNTLRLLILELNNRTSSQHVRMRVG